MIGGRFPYSPYVHNDAGRQVRFRELYPIEAHRKDALADLPDVISQTVVHIGHGHV